MKLNEEKMEEMKDKFGIEKMSNFADILLDMMVASGDKKAEVMKIKQDINKLTSEIIMEKYFLPNLQNEEITDKIHDFFMQIKLETENFIKEMEEN